jgi:hypothetical protein
MYVFFCRAAEDKNTGTAVKGVKGFKAEFHTLFCMSAVDYNRRFPGDSFKTGGQGKNGKPFIYIVIFNVGKGCFYRQSRKPRVFRLYFALHG